MKRTVDGIVKTNLTFRVVCHIYVYECIDEHSKSYGKMYVGQSRQEEGVRQNSHMKQDSKFDKLLQQNPEGFKHSVIDRNTFECYLDSNDGPIRRTEKATVLAKAQVWMNEREKFFIRYYDSYANGFNRTTGGQLGRDQAFYEAWLLDREVAWEQRLRALRLYKKMNGDLLVPALYRLKADVVSKHGLSLDDDLQGFRLGLVVRNIRTDHVIVGTEERSQLEHLNFVWDVRQYQRERMWRALHAYHKKHGHLLVPKTYQIQNNLTEDKSLHGYNLGMVVGTIRNGWDNETKQGRQTNAEEKAKLISMGFVVNVPEYERARLWRAIHTFHTLYGNLDVPTGFRFTPDMTKDTSLYDFHLRTAFTNIRTYKKHGVRGTKMTEEEHKTLFDMGFVWDMKQMERLRLWRAIEAYYSEHRHLRVPLDYCISDEIADTTLRGYTLGTRIDHIRQNHIKTTKLERERLSCMGFEWNMNQCRRDVIWRALRAFYADHKHLCVPLDTVLPTTLEDVSIQGFHLGQRVGQIRQKQIKMSPEEIKTLDKMGFKWSINKRRKK